MARLTSPEPLSTEKQAFAGTSPLKVRLIPSLLLSNGRCVKGVQFAQFRDVGHPVTAAKVYDAQGADELVFLDITATQENRPTLLTLVAQTAEACFMPLTVGGGIRTAEDVRRLLEAGADKVAVNTAAVKSPPLIREAARRFGSQSVVVAIDSKETAPGRYEVFVQGGKHPTGLEVAAWAKAAVEMGAGEIFLTSIDRDGMRSGFDLALIRMVSEAVDCPVIAAGGAGTLQHLVEAVRLGGASAVSAASLFHFTDQSVIKARAYMKQAGLNVRIA